MTLNRKTPVPLYYQIKRILQEKIERGDLSTGDRAPSERELAETYGVSRMTARQALTELCEEGFLKRLQGLGSFVTDSKIEQSLLQLTSFSEDMERRGLKPSARLLHIVREVPGKRIAQLLEIELTTPIVRIERLRLASNVPMSLESSFISSRFCPDLEKQDLTGSLYKLLETKYGVRLDEAKQALTTVHAGVHEARMLEVEPGAPLLLLQRVTRDPAGSPVEFVRAFYRGDKYTFVAELKRSTSEIRPINLDAVSQVRTVNPLESEKPTNHGSTISEALLSEV